MSLHARRRRRHRSEHRRVGALAATRGSRGIRADGRPRQRHRPAPFEPTRRTGDSSHLHPACLRCARLRPRERRFLSLLGKDEPPPSVFGFCHAVERARASAGSIGARPPFHHPAAVAANFHFVPHALPFLPPRKGTTACGAGLFGKVLLLHAFHGCSAAGGCCSFISRSESR